MISHTWVTRAKCTCGYLWTNPGSPRVCCACGATEIIDNVRYGGGNVTDEEEFKQSVAIAIGTAVDELTLIQG